MSKDENTTWYFDVIKTRTSDKYKDKSSKTIRKASISINIVSPSCQNCLYNEERIDAEINRLGFGLGESK